MNADLIVSPLDIGKMIPYEDLIDKDTDVSLDIKMISISDLKALIRSIPNNKGEKVYVNSEINMGQVSQGAIYNYQTFAQVSKLIGLTGLALMFDHFDFAGICYAEACTIVLDGKDARYMAIYIAPIVETVTKEKVRVPLENLRRRAEHETHLKLESYDGNNNNQVNLQKLINEWERILKNPDITSVQVLRDGMHRISLSHIAGTSQHAIFLNGTHIELPSVPIKTNSVVRTLTKPEKREDRFLGLSEEGWTNEKLVGIDG